MVRVAARTSPATPRLHQYPRQHLQQYPQRYPTRRKQKGSFVTLPENEDHPTDAGSTHAVDILAFVEAQEIPSLYFETPYYLAPAPGGERLYALLRETLRSTCHIGIACVVIQAQQHLAVLVPEGQSLVLNTLRWGCDGRHPAPDDCEADDDPYKDSDLTQQGQSTLCLRTNNVASRRQVEGTGIGALAERNMKTKKSADIILQELEVLLEDEDLISEDYLELALRRSVHPPDRRASRAGAPAHLHKHMQRRIRARR